VKPADAWAGEPNLALSPDGEKVAVSSVTRRGVDIWEMDSGRLLSALPERPTAVEWLEWSPDSQRLAVVHGDGEIAIWNLTEVEQVLSHLGLNP
jgi:WD40 repeat protein